MSNSRIIKGAQTITTTGPNSLIEAEPAPTEEE